MAKQSNSEPSWKDALSGIARRISAGVAPLVAPHMVSRFYELYRQNLAAAVEPLQVLDGLPSGTVQQGYWPLRVISTSGPAVVRNIWDMLTDAPHLIVCGPVGAGKSNLLHSLVWDFINRIDVTFIRRLTFKLFGESVDELLPLWCDLAEISRRPRPLLDVFVDSLSRYGFPGAQEFLHTRLESGQCVLFLDGLDTLDTRLQEELVKTVAAYPRNIWVITMRTGKQAPNLPGFVAIRPIGLAPTDLPAFVKHYSGEHSMGAGMILAACERNQSLAQMAETPLLLAAMCLSVKPGSGNEGRLANFYDACMQVLLEDWPKLKGYTSAHSSKDRLGMARRIAIEMHRAELTSADSSRLHGWISSELPESRRAETEEWYQDLMQLGLLAHTSNGSVDIAFCAPAIQQYLAAQWVVAAQQPAMLLPMVDQPWWREIIVLTAGLLPDPGAFMKDVAAHSRKHPYKWLLLANCVAEARVCEASLRAEVLDHLFALMEDDNASENWNEVAIAIAGTYRNQVRERLPILTRDADTEMRRRAVLALGRLHQDWAIPALGAAVTDAESPVRQQAAWALGFLPSSQSVRVLPRALRSTVAPVREAAAQSLLKLADTPELLRPVVTEFINALGDENDQVANLGELSLTEVGARALPQLTTALNDRHYRQSQRSRIARALGRLGDERALPILIEGVLSSTAEDLDGYIEAVVGIGGHAVPSLIKALEGKDSTTGGSLVASLVKIGPPAVGPLIEAIAGNLPEVRNSAVHALEEIGASAVEPLIYALLHDERFEVRRRALEILGHIGAAEVSEALVKALSDSDEGVRINAVRYLGNVGDVNAVNPLIDVLLDEGNATAMRKVAIGSLSALGDGRAIGPLLEILDEPNLRDSASNALIAMGDQVVESIIDVLHGCDTVQETRDRLWTLLQSLGERARPEDQTLSGVANVYGRLSHSTNPDEILELTNKILWWQHGTEVYQSLFIAHSLGQTAALESISDCGPLFNWLTENPDWFRPRVKEILWGMKDVVENVKLFRTLTRRDSQRDALLSSVDKLQDLKKRIEVNTLPFERAVIEESVQRWHNLILDAIKQLRGRASLLIELLTPNLALRESQRLVTAVFRLFNEGDSAARNLFITLQAASLHGIEIVGAQRRSLDPLGIGEERHVEIAIAPNGLRQADLVFEVIYDDDEREAFTHRFSCRIEFSDAPRVYIPIKSSPYIAGLPIKKDEMFFGRHDIFTWVRDNISGEHQENVLVLFGERRMGKTSVMYYLLRNPPTPQHICLLFDLQTYSYINTIAELLFEWATAIVTRLRSDGIETADPDWEQYNANPHRAFLAFCALLDQQLGDKRVVLMLDEFGILMAKVRDHVFDTTLFDFIRGVIQRTNKLTFLFTGAYEIRRMQEDYNSILFNLAKVRKISYLEPGEVTELIEKPVEGLLTYHPLVIQKIRTVTACHPYFVQYICDELVQLARSERKNYIELTDLDYVLRDVIRDATGNIRNSIYNYLEEPEKLTLAALANTTDDVKVFVSLGEVASTLERRHLEMPREQLMQALKVLEERDLVTEMRIGQQLRYSFRMGLVRMWLVQNEILLRLSQSKEG